MPTHQAYICLSTTARMRGRLVLNGTTEIRGSLGEISATHVSLATVIWLQTMVPLNAGDTVELQGYFRVADGYFVADHTSFWGSKVRGAVKGVQPEPRPFQRRHDTFELWHHRTDETA